MPWGPGTEQTSLALMKVLHLLTSTLWPPTSFWQKNRRRTYTVYKTQLCICFQTHSFNHNVYDYLQINAERLHFNLMVTISFKIQCAGVQTKTTSHHIKLLLFYIKTTYTHAHTIRIKPKNASFESFEERQMKRQRSERDRDENDMFVQTFLAQLNRKYSCVFECVYVCICVYSSTHTCICAFASTQHTCGFIRQINAWKNVREHAEQMDNHSCASWQLCVFWKEKVWFQISWCLHSPLGKYKYLISPKGICHFHKRIFF